MDLSLNGHKQEKKLGIFQRKCFFVRENLLHTNLAELLSVCPDSRMIVKIVTQLLSARED